MNRNAPPYLILCLLSAFGVAAGAQTIPASAAAASVNPFSGQSLALEATQAQLTQSKLATQILEEKMRQASLQQDIANLPKVKSVSVQQAETEVLNQALKQQELDEKLKAIRAQSQAAAHPAKRAPAHKFVEPTAQAAPAPPAPVVPRLLSVSDSDGAKSIVLQSPEGLLIAKDGQPTVFGVVRVLSSNSASVGSAVLHVYAASTLATIHPAYAPPPKKSGGLVQPVLQAQPYGLAAGPNHGALPPPVVAETVPPPRPPLMQTP